MHGVGIWAAGLVLGVTWDWITAQWVSLGIGSRPSTQQVVNPPRPTTFPSQALFAPAVYPVSVLDKKTHNQRHSDLSPEKPEFGPAGFSATPEERNDSDWAQVSPNALKSLIASRTKVAA